MRKHIAWAAAALTATTLGMAPLLQAAVPGLVWADPEGDDNGPGTYKYPTNPEYKPKSFDLRKLEVTDKGDDVEIKVTLGATIEDPWNSKEWPDGGGNGFSLQFVQVYFDTDHQRGAGFTKPLPGLGHAQFADDEAWDKVVLISPQPRARLTAELKAKAGAMRGAAIVPKSTRASGKSLIAVVKKADLGQPSSKWGVQAVVQSNEGFPVGKDILTRPVNQTVGPHRFGGGDDGDCDPHVMDILAGVGKGDRGEVDAQHSTLKYACGGKIATLPMVYGP
jgi:carbohydrate-binding DOMON domain-containing protein